MRVLIWGNSYPRVGGVETFITNLIEGSRDRQDFDFSVVSDGTVELELEEPYPIRMVPMTAPLKAAEPTGIVEAISKLRKHIGRYAPDVIHYNLCGPEIFFFERVISALRVPFVLTLHNSCFSAAESITGIFRRLIERAAAVTAVSHTVREAALRDLGDCASAIKLIPNAMPSKPAPTAYPGNRHILALGRLVEEKGFDTLVDAFALVRAKEPEARLTIAGSGPELEPLMQRAAALGLNGAVDFPGWIAPEQVHERMQAAALVAFPARWEEPFGLVALEAGQAARPCIVSSVGELPRIVLDGQTGYVVPKEDPVALSDAIGAVLADPAAAAQMGLRARAWVEQQFGFEAMIQDYLDLYRQAALPRG